jgi:hypothetical protein
MPEKKQLTINDLNIGETFRYSGHKGYLTVCGFGDLIDEDTGDVVTLVCCAFAENTKWLEFSQPIIVKIKYGK